MAKKKFDRENTEQMEKLPVVETSAPAERMQSKQQVASTMSAAGVDPGSSASIKIKEDNVPSQVTRTTKVAEIIKDVKGITGGGSGSSGSAALRAGSYSGTTAVIGDMSASTHLRDADRSTTRSGKKLDSTLKHVNYLYNEQVAVHYDESKPLAENPSATQGFNGTYRNEHARTQKTTGFVPAELYYDRSVDEIIADSIYPIMGQTIDDPYKNQTIESYSKTNDKGEVIGYENVSYPRGNHLDKEMKFSFNADGTLATLTFDQVDIAPVGVDVDVQNVSAVNGVIDANTAELDRQRMDEKAGDELMPSWNPLPRSIKNPTKTIGLLRDIEAATGAEIFMAYRKTANAFSYALNKAAKDGQRVSSPIRDMLTGCMTGVTDTNVTKSHGDDKVNCFVFDEYTKGSPALMIALYDSPSKFVTKGDFLIQPRGWRMHLQTADNNMNVFRLPEKFAKSVYANEVFSTIDKEYDPFLPVCITDKAALAHPIALNRFVRSANGKVESVPFRYKYQNGSNNIYIMNVHHPLVEGLINYLNSLGTKFVKLANEAKQDITQQIFTVRMVHSTTSMSLWSLFLLAATPFIMKSRLTSFIDVFDYEESTGEYPFSQLKTIKELDPKYSSNYSGSDYNEPLVVGKMKPAVAMRWVMPEAYWLSREYDGSDDIVMPWYHNELSYHVEGRKIKYNADGAVMSMPSVRSGSRFGFLDTVYGMSERELRLALDRQTVIPGLNKARNNDSSTITGLKVYKYGLSTDGQVVANFENSGAGVLTALDILSTPREIGFYIPALNGVLSQLVTRYDKSKDEYTTAFIDIEKEFFGDKCPGLFRIRYWYGTAQQHASTINAAASINVNRAMSLQQYSRVIINQRMVGDYRDICNRDFVVALSACFDNGIGGPGVINNAAMFVPFVIDGVGSTDNDDRHITLQKYYWTRVQRLIFAINPFDCSPGAKAAASKDSVPSDPYDFLYIFGCAGFRGSDYNEDTYNREKYRLNLGMLFVP